MAVMEPGPGPSRVQIQTQSGCDGRCVFCPNPMVTRSDLPKGRMAPEVFRKIIDDLATHPPRRISPYLMNEPLLDSRLPEFVSYITEKIPSTSTLITTNGTHLTEEMGGALLDSGLKRLKVSLQSLDRDTNMRLMGQACDPDKIVANVLAFQRLIKRRRFRRFDLRVSMIVTKLNMADIEHAKRFWRKHGIRLVTSALENRGGNIADAAGLNPHEMAEAHDNCIRPSREMCILWNGDVVLCCVDWWRTVILGNVTEQPIGKIWNGLRLGVIRHALECDGGGCALGECDHTGLPEICVNCTESAQPDAHRPKLKTVIRDWFGGRAPRS